MPEKILVVIEQRGGSLNRMSLEALAAAQAIGRDLGHEVEAIVPGHNVADCAAQVPASRVYLLEHPLLEKYTPDAYCVACQQAIGKLEPWLVLFAHTYQVRDFAPKLAAKLQRGFISDTIGYQVEDGQLVFTRQLFQGKMNADVSFCGPAPHFASVQVGAFRADQLASPAAQIEKLEAQLEPSQVRTVPGELFQEAKRTVDLSQAELILAVGRGIKEQENLSKVEALREALGAELAASRPICDNGWLPMERQVGSSGQTVSPKLYMALGISGAIQHIVGMKNSRVIVAVNKDHNAPIFEIADYGIVANLFDVLPPLVDEIKKAKA
jgi:electron transfer flavoprotein alpha subunit